MHHDGALLGRGRGNFSAPRRQWPAESELIT